MEGPRDNQVIDRVREANDLVEVVSGYVQLKRAGRTYKGLCPFHSEKTPSFTVSREKQLFYCFGCQTGGNVFHFIMKIENLDFPGALRFLAERAGIPLPEREFDPAAKARQERRARLETVVELAARFYRSILRRHAAGEPGRRYAAERGLDEDIIGRFGIGFAPHAWDGLAKFLAKRQADLAAAEEAGLLLRRRDGGYYDRFRNRLMFPIRDHRGRDIGFGGRAVDGAEPKYLNSPESPLFHKGEVLFGLSLAAEEIRRAGYAVVVEGYLDAVTCHRYGFAQTVASLGTALTEAQARLLARYTAEVRIAYDADAAGQAAAWRGLDLLTAAGFRVKVVNLPAGEDPDSFLRNRGAEEFARRLAAAEPLLDYKLGVIARRYDLTTLEGKVEAVRAMVPVLAGIESAVAREEYLPRVAATLGVSVGALEEELARLGRRRGDVGRNIFPRRVKNNRELAGVSAAGLPEERDVVKLLLLHPETAGTFAREVALEGLNNQALREIAASVLEAAAAGRAVDLAALADGLPEEAGHLLSELWLADDPHLRAVDPVTFFHRYRQRRREEALEGYEGRIEAAAAAGDLNRLNRLLIEYRWWQDPKDH
ncbi:MAG TPA: DNA primase [Firmicutes bacterium]|nr:DNA primase [Bacillota bacterium]